MSESISMRRIKGSTKTKINKTFESLKSLKTDTKTLIKNNIKPPRDSRKRDVIQIFALNQYSTDDFFKGKRVVLFSLPGAFTPTCTSTQLPGFDENYDKIKNIIQNSETVLWNGPAGYFENPNFANGSYEIANTIIKKNKNKSIYSVVGGGDTLSLIHI